MYEDHRGWLWVGTEQGLARWDGLQWTNYAGSIRAMTEDRAGHFWVGTANGLVRIETNQWVWFTQTNGLPSDTITSLCPDDQGVLWVGTSKGLVRFENDQWTTYTTAEGLAGNSIGYLLDDAQGSLWIGSRTGLMRARKQDLNDFARRPRSPGVPRQLPIRIFGKPDGMPTRECTEGSQPAACRTEDGRLWFPTVKGLVSVNPAELRRNTNPPPVVIEAVVVDNVLQNATGLRAPVPTAVTISAGKESLEIRYSSLNLATPDKGRFRYRLAGYETVWHEVEAATRRANYSKLPPDRYRFQVQACNEDGVWNELGASLAIEVLPPFWQTWWFISLSGACLLGLIVGSVHYVSTQRLLRQLAALRQQEALEKERARIARDIHDQVGANLTQVSLLGEMIEIDKDLPSEVEAHARQISQTALETTRALDEIVWTVNPSNDTLDGLINYICKYAQDYLALAGLKYRLEVPPDLPRTPISPELRHNAFLAAKEAINNVVKHARSSSAWLHLQLEPRRFTLEIQDDGRGVAPADESKGRNGLRNMRKRMEDVGGSFTLLPRPGGGTIVRLSAPLDADAPPG